ncbi:MAG: elongation factor P [Planctomycetota bacterium]
MASYNTSDFKKGLKVQIENEPYLMVDLDFMKPGKGQAVYRVRLKSLTSGRVVDKSYRSGDSLEAADVEERKMQFLYKDPTGFHFMDNETYEQFQLTPDQVGDAANYLIDEMEVDVVSWNGSPITVTPPHHVELTVTYTEPGAKGNSTGNVQKPATTQTGAEIMVPTFINLNDVVRVDTRTGDYIERVSKG